MLQVTAQIQPGDSGGPLADAQGRVIGMDTAASQPASGTGAAGFAIPIAAALTDVRAIRAGRAGPGVTIGIPGFLGVVVADGVHTDPLQQQLAASNTSVPPSPADPECLMMVGEAAVPRGAEAGRDGALVEGALCGTAAARAGLDEGDVITSVAGSAVSSGQTLVQIMNGLRPGRWVAVRWVTEAGYGRTATVQLGNAPAR